MYLVERFWSTFTAVLGVFTLSPVGNNDRVQSPLDMSLEGVTKIPGVGELKAIPHPGNVQKDGDLYFTPPGTDPDEYPFKCDYTAMKGWEKCSTAEDRTCWLRKKDNSEHPFDITTDYETRTPIGVVREYELTLEKATYDKDGFPFEDAKLFDGEYPGKWIQACWGDTIVVKVKNKLQYNGTSIHWHGIRQLNSMHMDGVNGVTQCPIAPDHEWTYEFKTMQYGSSWYHSHFSVQYADGAHGGMTIHGPTSSSWDEAVSPPIILTDWAHNSAFVAVSGGDGLVPNILVSGHGNVTRFNNKNKPKSKVVDPYFIADFEPPKPFVRNKRYLLRLINTSFDLTFLFTIDNHILTVVEMDFVPIDPIKTKKLVIGIGQRYDVIVEAAPLRDGDNPLPENGNFWMRTYGLDNCFGWHTKPATSPGYEKTGIIRYNKHGPLEPTSLRWSDVDAEKTNCSDPLMFRYYDLKPKVPWTVGPPINNVSKDDFELQFNNNLKNISYPLAQWTLGANPTVPLRIDYSNPTFLNLNRTKWTPMERMENLNYSSKTKPNSWVYLVIETVGGAHPIHLHGHDYAIIDAQARKFDPKKINLELNNPPRRDVVLLPANENAEGYIIIAFKVDNPGAWLVHCHIAFHISDGLGMQIMEDQPEANVIWPWDDSAIVEAQKVCREWNTWVKNTTNHFPEVCKNDTTPDTCFQNDSGV